MLRTGSSGRVPSAVKFLSRFGQGGFTMLTGVPNLDRCGRCSGELMIFTNFGNLELTEDVRFSSPFTRTS